MTLKIHRHLADQHLFNLSAIQEEKGNMYVGPINLNADFFHPNIENSMRQRQAAKVCSGRRYEWEVMDETVRRGGELDVMFGNGGMESENQVDFEGMVDWDLAGDLGLMPNPSGIRRSWLESGHVAPCSAPRNSPASDVALQMYSLSTPNLRSDSNECPDEILCKVRVRFAHYQRKLELCLASSSIQDFDECLLDWWDEIFPSSAGIHFFNRQSPVPRMSHLQSFLTTPCPKDIGIVQCEIERVKISSKKKLFATYEYRLFIRDAKNDNPHNLDGIPPRKDSVLLVAKNKVKKSKSAHAPGSTTNESASKRGATNYYMCLPQQRDVDLHFKNANRNLNLENQPAPTASLSSPVIIGRVQGNFIGTEFQILAPVTNKAKVDAESSDPSSSSDDDGTDGDAHPMSAFRRRRASVDTPHGRGRGGNGLVRLARRASLTMARRPSISTRRPSMSHFRRQSMDPADGDDEPKHKASRRLSWTENLPGGKKSILTKRSAIANSEMDGHHCEYSVVEEEECGAITYTANLLGNRPRIMDVCVPKVMDDGTRCHAWTRHADTDAENGDAISNNRMLNQFKAIQQAREHSAIDALEGQEATTPDIDDHGLMILQNRAPWWNVEIGAFVLNFGGRVSVASVKNFQLCETTNQEHVMLQFGRIQGRHSFTMDVQHPLSPMQAFAIAISSLQSKISFG
jgi:hypothetical protein